MSAFSRLLEELETQVADAKSARGRLDSRLRRRERDPACNEPLGDLRIALDKIDTTVSTLLDGTYR